MQVTTRGSDAPRKYQRCYAGRGGVVRKQVHCDLQTGITSSVITFCIFRQLLVRTHGLG